MPAREVTLEDQVWTVHQKGAARIGSGRGSGIRILSVGVEAPGNRENPRATRYVLARSLDEVAEDALVSLVREIARAPDPDPERGGRPGGYPRYRRRRSRKIPE